MDEFIDKFILGWVIWRWGLAGGSPSQGHVPEVCLTLSFAVYQSDALLPNMLHTVFGFITHGLRSNGSAREHDIFKISILENVMQS